MFMKVSEMLQIHLNLIGQEITASCIAAEILENIAISNLEQDVEFSQANCLMREFEL